MNYFSKLNLKRGLLSVLILVILGIGTLWFIYRDNIVYVGPVRIVDVDCAQKAELLDEVYINDQRVRKSGIPLREMGLTDHHNQEIVISILEKCGMPTLAEVTNQQLGAIWLVLQHSEHKYRKQYFPFIEEAMKRGDLKKSKYATMLDRILMDEGEPQLYGSQIQRGQLYQLAAPETINERRAEMGMEPIEDYLRHFNIKFTPNAPQ